MLNTLSYIIYKKAGAKLDKARIEKTYSEAQLGVVNFCFINKGKLFTSKLYDSLESFWKTYDIIIEKAENPSILIFLCQLSKVAVNFPLTKLTDNLVCAFANDFAT